MKHEINSKEEIVNLSALANAWSAVLKNGENEKKPKNCKGKFDRICSDCEFKSSKVVRHPVGTQKLILFKSKCDLEYWEEDL